MCGNYRDAVVDAKEILENSDELQAFMFAPQADGDVRCVWADNPNQPGENPISILGTLLINLEDNTEVPLEELAQKMVDWANEKKDSGDPMLFE